MKFRVIAGMYGGRSLDAPPGSRTHPMSERVRNALFNSLGNQVEGAEVLDCFAGTGALGIEALSRGAAHATFVERDRVAQRVIRGNLETLGVDSSSYTIVSSPVAGWLSSRKTDTLYDLVLADPPYHDLQLSTVSRLFSLLKPDALMVLSHTGRGEVPIRSDEIVVVDNRSYGTAHLTFFRREIPKKTTSW